MLDVSHAGSVPAVLRARPSAAPRTTFSPNELQAATFLVRSAAVDLAGRVLTKNDLDCLIDDLNRALHLLYDWRRKTAEQEAVEYLQAMARAIGPRDPRRARELLATAEEISGQCAERLAAESAALSEGGSL